MVKTPQILTSLVTHRVKNLPTMQETLSLIPGSGKSGEGNGNPFQYPCLEKPMDRGAWGATIHTVHGVTRTERLTFSLSMILLQGA